MKRIGKLTIALVPDDDVSRPEVSIVIPALNEELTVGDFVEWCKAGLASAGVAGEVLIVDSSTDQTSTIAVGHGARVLRIPKRGLGRAYIDALPYIRGKYVLMGDADCTYDFRNLKPFVDKLRDGYEFVMVATDDGAINAEVAAAGKNRRLWVNAADDPKNCDFILPAVVRKGKITLAASTSGTSPACA